jgi:tRNA (cmo5U34)-methyltransferase
VDTPPGELEQPARDTGYAPPKWAFDDEVTRVFEDMLWRSIPGYAEMRSLCHQMARRFRTDHTHVVDLGCSRGGAIAPLVEEYGTRNTYDGIEISAPMAAAARARFADRPNVRIHEADLRRGVDVVGEEGASVVLSILTLQFVPIEHRQRVVRDVHAALAPGGALVLVEKVLGATARANELLVDAYYEFKRGNGYSQDEIDRKKLALEGVLVPQTEGANVEMLVREGFRVVECFWRYLNFSGWVAIK